MDLGGQRHLYSSVALLVGIHNLAERVAITVA
jgi:hypothetical protein